MSNKKENETIKTTSDGYVSRYSDSIKNTLDAILASKTNAYVPENDATYNHYKKSYEDSAKKASEHAAGLSAELTGGYGNSYGATAAQNAYSAEMQKLTDLIPKLEQQYYDRQKAEEDSAYERLTALMKLDAEDYDRYSDSETRKLAREKQDRAVYENDRDYNRSVYESGIKNSMAERELSLKEKSADAAAAKSSGTSKYAAKSDGSFNAASGYDFLNDYEDRMRSPEECLYALVDMFGEQDGFYNWIKHVPLPYDESGKTYGDLLSEMKKDYDLKPSSLNISDRDAMYRNAQLGALPPSTYKI